MDDKKQWVETDPEKLKEKQEKISKAMNADNPVTRGISELAKMWAEKPKKPSGLLGG